MSQQARFVGFSLTKVEMCGGVCGFVVCVKFSCGILDASFVWGNGL